MWVAAVLSCAAALTLAAACGSKSGLRTGSTRPVEQDAAVAPQAQCLWPGEAGLARAVGAACAFDGEPRVGVVVIDGHSLLGVTGAGEVTTLFEFGTQLPFTRGSTAARKVLSLGGYVAAAMAVTEEGVSRPEQAAVELVVFDPEMRLIFHELRLVAYENYVDLWLTGNALGMFALGVETYAGKELTLSDPFGNHVGPLPEVVPGGAPDAFGRLLARSGADYSWLEPCTGTLSEPRSAALEAYSAEQVVGGQLHYVDATRPTAFAESYDEQASLPLGLEPNVLLLLSHPSGWLLLGSSASPYAFDLAHVRDGALAHVEMAFPDGLRRFRSDGLVGFDTAATQELEIDSQGQVVLGLRDDALGRLYTTSDGSNWQPLGYPVGEVRMLEATERNGTYLIHGTPYGQLLSSWSAAPAGSGRVDYEQVQLVRPSSGTELVLYQADESISQGRDYQLSDDGGCAALLVGGRLTVISAVTGESHEFSLPAVTQYGELAFVGADQPGP